jgi:tetratricopeptide (TPR) repeat protein
VAKSYNIANIYAKQSKYEEALERNTKSLDIKTRILGGCRHLIEPKSYNGLGNGYKSLGKYQEALEMYTKSLDIKTRILDGDTGGCCHGPEYRFRAISSTFRAPPHTCPSSPVSHPYCYMRRPRSGGRSQGA